MRIGVLVCAAVACFPAASFSQGLRSDIERDVDAHLFDLFVQFHENPELSLVESKTAARVADELRAAGFEVTEGIGGTGVVAVLANGPGPLVMMRADMDGLPVQEMSGLPYASTATQRDPVTGDLVPVMHACGHDVHITSLIGTARQMAKRRDAWQGTLMLIAQPAEERGLGARAMLADGLWERFGTPDYVLGFHVSSQHVAGIVNILEGPINASSNTVDIIVHGIGTHGAAPHQGKDPIILGMNIGLALQQLITRELSPREPAVITIGSFHAGTKHNVISDEARLQLTVRSTSAEARDQLLAGIRRIAEYQGRSFGLPDELLPEVVVADNGTPVQVNDSALASRLATAWEESLGADRLMADPPTAMTGEDFALFGLSRDIPSVFWGIGGTPAEEVERAEQGGAPVPAHHSPLFKIEPRASVGAGVESTVLALFELMPGGSN
jgi:amidohydrolase